MPKRSITLFVAAVAIAALACRGDEPTRAKPETAQSAKPPADAQAPERFTEPAALIAARATLTATTGTVEVMRGGVWSSATEGELQADDAVRTHNGSATVVIERVKIIIERNSEVTVRQLSEKLANLRLERGRLSADLEDGDLTLRVSAAGSSAVAEAKQGAFTIFNSGHGLVAVASRAGAVTLSSSGGDVVLEAGDRARVTNDGKPAKKKIRRAILLKVVWPKDRTTESGSAKIRGKADVGTIVEVNGETVAVSEAGEFRAVVSLKRGKNTVSVSARDLAGREATHTRRITVDRKPPAVKAHTDNLWKKKARN